MKHLREELWFHVPKRRDYLNITAAQVLDIPLPPKVEQVVPIGAMATMDVPGGPDEVLGWFSKNLTPHGWSANKVTLSGDMKSQGFRKGGRTLTVMARQFQGQKHSSVQFQHVAYAE